MLEVDHGQPDDERQGDKETENGLGGDEGGGYAPSHLSLGYQVFHLVPD